MIGRMIAFLMVFCAAVPAALALAEKGPTPWWPDPAESARYLFIPHGPDEVFIGQIGGVDIPVGRILLVRKGKAYLALKFTNTWLGETKYDMYASYEFHYQGDGSGDFSMNNVESGASEFYNPPLRGRYNIRPSKRIAQFGKIAIEWGPINFVLYGRNELAPTPWTAISEVNIHDPRLKWYRKDTIRANKVVPIDRLWDGETGASSGK